jgi:hypothetical protein
MQGKRERALARVWKVKVEGKEREKVDGEWRNQGSRSDNVCNNLQYLKRNQEQKERNNVVVMVIVST